MNNKEYRQLINNTVVPSFISEEEKHERYTPITTAVNQILPRKLYRFRKCSEQAMSAFMRDELWFSSGSSMNDDFEARLYYDKKQINKWLDDSMDKDGCLKVISQISSIDKLPDIFYALIPNVDDLYNRLKSISSEQALEISRQLIDFVRNDLNSSLEYIVQEVQSLTKFACFSDKIHSDMMWGRYANNATGFALEYEFGTENPIIYNRGINNQNTIWLNLFPVIYGKQRLDTTEYAVYLFQIKLLLEIAGSQGLQIPEQWLRDVLPCPDEFMVTKLALNKSSEWRPEREWRMFYISNDLLEGNQPHSFVHYRPSAVYLGRKISELNQKVIVDIAKEKHIPVYKMGFNDKSREYKLRKYRVE